VTRRNTAFAGFVEPDDFVRMIRETLR